MIKMYTIIIVFTFFSIVAIGLAIFGGRIDRKMDAVSLYRVASCLVVASIISGAISFCAISYSLKGESAGGITSQEAIVDILGILVTVLMGWNIISLVDFKKKADEIEYFKQDFRSVIGAFMQLNFDSFLTKGSIQELLDNCFNALKEIHSCLNDSIRQMAEDKLLGLIKHACDEQLRKNKIYVYPEKRNTYLHLLDHIDSVYSKDIEIIIKEAEDDQQSYSQNVQNNDSRSDLLEITESKRDV